MKGQIWHCKNVKWGVKRGNEKEVANCLVVFTCFEKNDQKEKVLETVRRIEAL